MPALWLELRVDSVVVMARLSDGTSRTVTMTAPRNVTMGVDWSKVDGHPWDLAFTSARCEKVTVEVELPSGVEEG